MMGEANEIKHCPKKDCRTAMAGNLRFCPSCHTYVGDVEMVKIPDFTRRD
jgi:hypothetical protein